MWTPTRLANTAGGVVAARCSSAVFRLARVAMLELRLTALTEPDPRAETLGEIAQVLDEKLARPSDALSALLRAVTETPDQVRAVIESAGGVVEPVDAPA